MDFPKLTPSSRSFDPGDFPISRYKAMDGYEVRVLHGSKMTGSRLQLSYNAIADKEAETFLVHYRQQVGTFLTFHLSDGAREGWAGNKAELSAVSRGNVWRYEKPPSVTQVRPGVSNVVIELSSVLS